MLQNLTIRVPRYEEGNQIQYIGDDCYYSPNNSTEPRRISLEPILQNPFNPAGGRPPSIRYRDLRPRPWTASFGWTSFIPVVPCYRTRSLLSVLCYSPPIERLLDESGMQQGFRLVEDNTWHALEQNISKAVCALKHSFHLPVILPFLPHILGYNSVHTNRLHLEQSLEESREWFLVWIGALSYCLYASQNHPDSHRRRQEHRYPYWRKPLEDAGLSDAWIDEVVYSPIADYVSTPRLGAVILDINKTPPGDPEVHWFSNTGIPVWYRWGPVEEEAAREWIWLARYRPPSSLEAQPEPRGVSLGSRTNPGALSKRPQEEMPPIPCEEMRNAKESTPPEDYGKEVEGSRETGGNPSTPQDKEPEWVAFFRNREAERPALLARETPQQRERRLNRMREPPISSARVFEWTLDEKSDELIWIRVPVPAKWRADTLRDYGKAQKRYDPFHNDWDVCAEFGSMTQDEEEEMDIYGGCDALPDTLTEGALQNPSLDSQELSDPPPEPAAVAPVPHLVVESGSVVGDPPFLTHQTPSEPVAVPPRVPLVVLDPSPDFFQADEPSGQEIEEVFTVFYGLAYPVPGIILPQEGHETRRDIFLRLLGQVGAGTPARLKEEFFSSKPYLPAQHLLNCVLDRTNDFRGVWDLQDGCVQPVTLRARFRKLRYAEFTSTPRGVGVTKGNDIFDDAHACYILQETELSVPWKLALISSSVALAVCRLPVDFNAVDVATWCARRGVPFRILYPSSSPRLRSPKPHIPFPIPVRPFNHKFTREDYDSYVHIRTRLLGQPHMQAALKRGGIVWRLALGTLGISNVCGSPSLEGCTRRLVLGNSEFMDNALTMDELDLICGAYECISGVYFSDGGPRAPFFVVLTVSTEDGKQRALKSWWPLARYYEKEECGENYGRWTFRRESWYARRLQDVERDDFSARPYTYTEWKSLQHGPRMVRVFHSAIEKASLEVLKEHCIDA